MDWCGWGVVQGRSSQMAIMLWADNNMSTRIKIIVFLSLLLQGLAVICGQGCTDCQDTGCRACQPAFFLHNSTCLTCSTDCLTCTNALACQSCVYGHYLSDSSCLPCSNGCLSCLSQTNCSRCANTYFLSEGRCRSCPSTCGICNATACLHCNSGFFLNKTNCQFCGAECNKCSDGVGCEKCITGYFLQEGKCLPCLDNCEICQDNSSCLKCWRGYYPQNGGCTTCQTCQDPADCLATQLCIDRVSLAASTAQKQSEQHSTSPIVYPLILVIVGSFLAFYFACLVPFARKHLKTHNEQKYNRSPALPCEKQRDPLYEIFHLNRHAQESVTETNVRLEMDQHSSQFFEERSEKRLDVSLAE